MGKPSAADSLRKSISLRPSTAMSRLDDVATEHAPSLGQGIDAPVANIVAITGASVVEKLGQQQVPLTLIDDNPFNARRIYRNTDVQAMADSYKVYGQQSAAKGFWKDGRCVLVYGHRRKRAAITLSWQNLTVDMVPPYEDAKALYLASREENEQRTPPTPFDDALVWQELLDKRVYVSQEELAVAVASNQSTVAKVLALREIPSKVVEECIAKGLTSLRFLYNVKIYYSATGENIDATLSLVQEAADKELSTRELEARIQELKVPKREAAAAVQKPRSEVHKVRIGVKQGLLKEFAASGRVELKIAGLDEDVRAKLIEGIKALFKEVQA